MQKIIVLSLALIVSACGSEMQTAGSYDAARTAAEGDAARAILSADEAREHAELALAQADRDVATWRDNVISD